jgi:hypothetical protein
MILRVASPLPRCFAYESRAYTAGPTPDQKAQLQAKATAEVRSVSSYVAKLIVGDLARG